MNLRDVLEGVREEHGKLTPEIVRDEARDPSHPLHHRVFDCPPEVASERYYLNRAAKLLRVVKVPYVRPNGENGRVRAYHPVRNEDEPTSEYRPVEDIARDEVATRVLLAQMEREWRAFKARYEQFDEFRQLVLGDIGEAA